MTTDSQFSWSQFTRWRSECHERFGKIHDLPLRSPYEELPELLNPDTRVLDIGAGAHKPLQQFLEPHCRQYFSLDNDPAGDFNFRSFDEIPPELKFDLIVGNQLLEHLTIGDSTALLGSAFECLLERGHLLLTVPNAAHPIRQRETTHVTAWLMVDLYSLLRNIGFRVSSLARYNKQPLTVNPIKRLVVNIMSEVYRVDWCDSLMIIGQKASGNAQAPEDRR